MPSYYYAAGTASVAAGGTTVTGVGTAWLSTLLPGDTFEAGQGSVTIASVNSNTSITLARAWPTTAVTAGSYVARYDSPQRYEAAYLAQRVRELINDVAILDDTVPYYRALAINQNAPPATPSIDDTYVVGTAPTGVWAGQAKTVAQWNGVSWSHLVPEGGWHAYSVAANLQYVYVGSAWQLTQSGVLSVNGATGAISAAQLKAAVATTYIQTLLDDADQAAARATLGAQAELGYAPLNKAGDTMAGALTTGNLSVTGTLTMRGPAVSAFSRDASGVLAIAAGGNLTYTCNSGLFSICDFASQQTATFRKNGTAVTGYGTLPSFFSLTAGAPGLISVFENSGNLAIVNGRSSISYLSVDSLKMY